MNPEQAANLGVLNPIGGECALGGGKSGSILIYIMY